MTSEEMERAIEFLLERQSASENRIEQTNAQIVQTNAQLAETSRQLALYAETQTQFIEIATRSIEALAAAQVRTNKAVARLAERSAEIDARLNTLLNVVERHITETHGGQG